MIIPLGACLTRYSEQWSKLGITLNLNEGLKIPWIQGKPTGRGCAVALVNSEKEDTILQQLIQEEIEEGTIELCSPDDISFYSLIFLFPKSNGGFRKVMDCRTINSYAPPTHFKMDDCRTVREIIQYNDWGVTLDLKHAYSHIPMEIESRRWLGFRYKDKNYRQRAMCFGLAIAPQTFTLLIRRVIAQLRPLMRIVAYLDDFLLLFKTKEEAETLTVVALQLFTSLGLTIEWQKSKLIPTHRFTYLGMDWDTIAMNVQPIGKRITKAKRMVRDRIRQTLKGVQTTAHTISKIVGILQSMSVCEPQTFVRSRNLITVKDQMVTDKGWNDSILLDSDQMEELLWWDVRLRNPLECNLIPFVVQAIITSDASQDGLGATLMIDNNKFAAQITNECYSTMTSNAREMLAILFALEEFTETLRYYNITDILIQTDNQTCAADIQKRSSCSQLNQILVQIMDYSGRNNWRLQSQWIPGVQNTIADKLSRGTDGSDFQLKQEIFDLICLTLELNPEIDAFATDYNTKTEKYISWKKESLAIATDAMKQNWGNQVVYYMFPHIPLINRVVGKLIQDKAKVLLITPDWNTLLSLTDLERIANKSIKLHQIKDCCEEGPLLAAAKANLPPGSLRAWVKNIVQNN
ncbi:MAG: putative reverse transcriptase [Streblomastix strix]|uniref:Putative reverse transcriptase n=1 Tax=Streblomastix strix TaxID=222440 RepID=A0A5J4UU14_9EUKA|nr:MAG: putative reverse transcriptase [Streblomastix strix]